ncbi:hypothetical protein [Bradyrhizobium sp. WSM3983]|uniref:hypothetical protein n=1 Tax=Bradyrhizobium sp. WSM3983 TaxID=1038867 RepID=UPI000483D64A|nr:hypothetical protein [Bradyrhizobium sp. WSM3983]
MSGWIPVFTLPNVFVKDPIEVEYVALVSPDDSRCKEYGKTNKNFPKFLRSFTDAFRRKVTPSVVLMREDAPKWVRSHEAIGGFRDAISISAVAHNKTSSILYSNARSHQYSTFFDFYAWNLSKELNILVTDNPAMLGMDTIDDFMGQSIAGLPTSRSEGLDTDETLLNALLGEWPRRFSRSSATWRSRALFRSLNMAHAAAQIPPLVDLTAQSLGRHVALWVSAFEILTHPQDGDAGLKEVYRVLESVDWRMADCKDIVHDCYLGRSGRRRKGNLPCWIYGEMYHARNDYLHGNALSDDRLVVKSSGRNLFQFAPTLYRLLLTGFLGIDFYGPPTADKTTEVQRILNFRFENRQGDHERAISRVLKPPAKDD